MLQCTVLCVLKFVFYACIKLTGVLLTFMSVLLTFNKWNMHKMKVARMLAAWYTAVVSVYMVSITKLSSYTGYYLDG